MKTIRIWFMAHFQNYPFWRVEYKDGKKTYPLYSSEAYSLRDVFNGRLFIDYEYGNKFINPTK